MGNPTNRNSLDSAANNKTAQHLMHLINTRNDGVPNFSLLLGSGASSTSNVKTAQDMIDEWRRILFGRPGDVTDFEQWLDDQPWYKHEDEYSMLFEEIFDQPSQRRVYIEECIKHSHPSWGYVYLTNLLSKRFFDVVFTTNFDDLINEACYVYSDGLRPIVAAHDSAIQGIRVTAGRPKIIKLHGDFLYDNIKNTLSELETLEANTKRKLSQFAKEYGLVVLGYSGRDRSVMDNIELLLREDDNFRQGVYWCYRSGDSMSGRLRSLLRRDRVYLVEINGFDQFAAELHDKAGLTLPKAIAEPFEIAKDRVRLLIKQNLKSHPIIGSHMQDVQESIDSHIFRPPPEIKAITLSSRGEFQEAIPIWEQIFLQEPDDADIAYQYGEALAGGGKLEELAELALNSPLPPNNKTYFLLRAGRNEEVVEIATKSLDELPTVKGRRNSDRAITRINRAIALKRLGRIDAMMSDLEFLDQNGDTVAEHIRAGVAALRGDRKELFVALNASLGKSISLENLMTFPVFEDYRDDPDFINLFGSEDK